MKYIFPMILFSFVVSADDKIVDEVIPPIPLKKTECIILRGDSLPTPNAVSIVIYPIEEFIRIEEDGLP